MRPGGEDEGPAGTGFEAAYFHGAQAGMLLCRGAGPACGSEGGCGSKSEVPWWPEWHLGSVKVWELRLLGASLGPQQPHWVQRRQESPQRVPRPGARISRHSQLLLLHHSFPALTQAPKRPQAAHSFDFQAPRPLCPHGAGPGKSGGPRRPNFKTPVGDPGTHWQPERERPRYSGKEDEPASAGPQQRKFQCRGRAASAAAASTPACHLGPTTPGVTEVGFSSIDLDWKPRAASCNNRNTILTSTGREKGLVTGRSGSHVVKERGGGSLSRPYKGSLSAPGKGSAQCGSSLSPPALRSVQGLAQVGLRLQRGCCQ